MAPQLADAVDDYGIVVISSGGFNSVTENHRLAWELTQFADDGFTEVIEILHIGDHDPSGAHVFLAVSEDVTAFAEFLRPPCDLHTPCRDTRADRGTGSGHRASEKLRQKSIRGRDVSGGGDTARHSPRPSKNGQTSRSGSDCLSASLKYKTR